MIDSPVFFSGIGGSGMLPLASHRPRRRRPRRGLRPLARRRAHAAQVRLSALARHPAVPAGRIGPSGGHDPGHLGRGRADRARRRPREGAGPDAPHAARVPRRAAQRGAAQRRGRRHQRQVDRDRNDRLDPPRLPSPADGDERRGDEEFRHARRRPFASALVGDPELFVSEVDESDGSIALYRPEIAVLTNISLDHKEMDELRRLFAGFLLSRAQGGAQPRRSRNARARRGGAGRQGHRLRLRRARAPTSWARTCSCSKAASRSRSKPKASGTRSGSQCPGRHNASNALAAIAATRALGVADRGCGRGARPVRGAQAAARDGRRSARGVTVIDDFAHNPDKIDATLATLARAAGPAADHVPAARLRPARQDGRAAGGQPRRGHGAGRPALPARPGLPGRHRRADARLRLARRSRSRSAAARPSIFPSVRRSARRLLAEAQPGDRILIMGARDDTLIDFARELVERLGSRN